MNSDYTDRRISAVPLAPPRSYRPRSSHLPHNDNRGSNDSRRASDTTRNLELDPRWRSDPTADRQNLNLFSTVRGNDAGSRRASDPSAERRRNRLPYTSPLRVNVKPDSSQQPSNPFVDDYSRYPAFSPSNQGAPVPEGPASAPAPGLAAGSARRRRGSDNSDETLVDVDLDDANDVSDKRFSLSSYRHPYDISPPVPAHNYGSERNGLPQGREPRRPSNRRSVSFAPDVKAEQEEDEDCKANSPAHRRRGVFTNLVDLYHLERGEPSKPYDEASRYHNSAGGDPNSDADSDNDSTRSLSRTNTVYQENGNVLRSRIGLRRADSTWSVGSIALDPDDPRLTGKKKEYVDDDEDLEMNCRKAMLDQRREEYKNMSYRQRKKERAKMRIEFNVTSMLNRQNFLLRLAKALLIFGAPSHRIESQLTACAHILEVAGEFIHIPGLIICSFGDDESATSKVEFIKSGGRIDLGNLHKVHQIYRQVVHDEISAKKAEAMLKEIMDARAMYGVWTRCALAFWLSALICPLGFGGSFVDMWIAGLSALVLAFIQLKVMSKSNIYGHIFEVSIALGMSFAARGLSSIPGDIFCYTAISSSSIISILPGYLILSSSLELASKNMLCGSVKIVYALIYTLSLGFGLQIGSDLYLLLDQGARHDLREMSSNITQTFVLAGNFTADDGRERTGVGLSGTFTFQDHYDAITSHVVNGCFRPPNIPWYLQPFPWWTQFIIVPLFSILSSMANLQRLVSADLVVMVIISSAGYAANKAADHFIFNRSDVVSAIGAFAIGLLGNIYSRKCGGTAFTVMVTGVLFLVPSGLSAAGGITAEGSGIDIGGNMISVAIGVTVGLFMSQALVYTFGTRKSAAVFSF